MTTRTNPAYAALAYRKAVVRALVNHLREDYMALSSTAPNKELYSDDVYKIDSLVPPEAIQGIVEELEQEEQCVKLEMAKFTFDLQEKRQDGLLNSKKTKESRHSRGGQGGNQGRR